MVLFRKRNIGAGYSCNPKAHGGYMSGYDICGNVIARLFKSRV